MEAKPAAVDDVIEVFRGYHGPAAAGNPRFRAALLFAGHDAGAPDRPGRVAGLAGAGGQPGHRRGDKAGVLDSTACVIGAVEGYRLVFSSARKP
jgi:hypothetical protein